jgi:putative transposase
MKLLDYDHGLSIRKQCEVLEVSRSSFYFEPKGESHENLELMRLMDIHYLNHPTAGILRMQDHLHDLGFKVNYKRVRRLLRLMGLQAIYPKRKLSIPGSTNFIKPYLLKGYKVNKPNQVWAIDITYIPMKNGFMYLTAVIDLYSRFIVGWALSNTLAAEVSLNVVKEAVEQYGCPEIINSDQGSQFTSQEWIIFWENKQVKISMDGKGRAIDNIFIERFWRTIKYDHVYIRPAKDGIELYDGLKTFFNYYNFERSHQGINRKKPNALFERVA